MLLDKNSIRFWLGIENVDRIHNSGVTLEKKFLFIDMALKYIGLQGSFSGVVGGDQLNFDCHYSQSTLTRRDRTGLIFNS